MKLIRRPAVKKEIGFFKDSKTIRWRITFNEEDGGKFFPNNICIEKQSGSRGKNWPSEEIYIENRSKEYLLFSKKFYRVCRAP